MYISLPYKLEMANTQKEGGGSKARYKGLAHPMRTPVEAKIRRVKTKVYGFTLDSSSQWYVTDNWVVTHNSGKTTASLYIAAQVQKAGGVVAFVDAEHSFTKAYAEALGVNCNDLLLSQPFTGEDAFEIMARLVSTGIVDLIIVDSVSALVPKVEREGEISDQGMALQARLLSKGLRVLTSELSKNKTSIIFINQVRETLSSFGYGPKTSSTGGKALKFYASVRLETKKIKTLKDSKDIAYGTVMSVTGVKNKVAAPNRTAELEIHFGKGINVEADLLEVALLDGLVNTLVYDSGDGKPVKLGLGKEKSVEALKDLPDICKAIRANYSKKAPKKPAKE
jgi:recombination protein RecA